MNPTNEAKVIVLSHLVTGVAKELKELLRLILYVHIIHYVISMELKSNSNPLRNFYGPPQTNFIVLYNLPQYKISLGASIKKNNSLANT